MRIALPLLALVSLAVPTASAHVVPRGTYDRTITVHLQRTGNRGVVTVHYRLEVDEFTLLVDELNELKRRELHVNPLDFRGEPLKFYAEFLRHYGPMLAGNLEANVNGTPLEFHCRAQSARLHDDKGEVLGHVRCDLVFTADFQQRDITPGEMTFHEGNFEDKKGAIHLSCAGVPLPQLAASCVAAVRTPVAATALLTIQPVGVRILQTIEPGSRQRGLSAIERAPGADEKMRRLSILFDFHAQPAPPRLENPLAQLPAAASPPAAHHGHADLLQLFRSNYSLIPLLLIFAGIGAVHALTPGHGKTLVAAYLVGQRGTVWHAIFLGAVTTITHTGAVLIFAIALNFVPSESLKQVQAGLGLAMGMAVSCLGFWLLLKRLTGQADHVHIGGHSHHHHHHGAGHHTHEMPSEVRWWNLVVLGMTGGIIPCWDAVAILFLCIGRGELWLALPLVLSFSAGLAGVLVLIGILVVKARNFATSRWGEGRFTRILPILSSLVILALGLWLCRESVR